MGHPAPARKRSLADCRRRLESIERIRYHSVEDGVALARLLLDDLGELAGSSDRPSELTGSVEALRHQFGSEVGETTLDRSVRELRRLIARLELEGGDAVGLSVWLRRQPPRVRYYIGAGIVLVLVLVLGGTMLQERSRQSAISRYEELYNRGNSLLFDGKHAEAIDVYRKALALLPDDPRSSGSYNNLGWAYQQLGRLDEALASYRRAVELDPASDRARNNLAAAERAKSQPSG